MKEFSPEATTFELLIVTGTSGGGKSMALHHLEDLGYFCTDNIIPALLTSFVDLLSTQFSRVALVVDLRGGSFFDQLSGCLHTLKEKGFHSRILFLEASDEVLVARFSETRRRHPLAREDMGLLEAIQKEKERLSDIREQADILINTSQMKASELRSTISERLMGQTQTPSGLVISVLSFGYRYGIPMDADLTFDVRFLPNPYYNRDLRAHTGLDRPVRDYVLNKTVTQEFIQKFFDFITYLIPHYRQEGKSNLTVGVGCTGGRHRSVAIARELVRVLREKNYYVIEKHRDIFKDEARYHPELKRKTPRDLKIVALGGGTGLSTLLRGLKHHYEDITAIVTVSDDGGSSGRLRKDLGVLPPGDIRNCLTALADEEQLLTELFNYRFKGDGGDLSGHSFGNLFLTVMAELMGDFNRGIQEASSVLAVRGTVVPVSLDQVILEAVMDDGVVIQGESAITEYGGTIRSLHIMTEKGDDPEPFAEALSHLEHAEAIILAPGSLYTSIIPHMLFPEVVQTIMSNSCPKLYVGNIMSQAGETTHLNAMAHIQKIYQHAGQGGWLSHVLLNKAKPSARLIRAYAAKGSKMLSNQPSHFKSFKGQVILADLLSESDVVRHEPTKLARCIFELLQELYFPANALKQN